MRGMPPRGHPLGGAARVPYVRPRRLLRFFRRQARDAALSRNGAPGHALGDARGCLDLVLRPRVRGTPRPGSENARVRGLLALAVSGRADEAAAVKAIEKLPLRAHEVQTCGTGYSDESAFPQWLPATRPIDW